MGGGGTRSPRGVSRRPPENSGPAGQQQQICRPLFLASAPRSGQSSCSACNCDRRPHDAAIFLVVIYKAWVLPLARASFGTGYHVLICFFTPFFADAQGGMSIVLNERVRGNLPIRCMLLCSSG